MFCPQCGTPVDDYAVFCCKCGCNLTSGAVVTLVANGKDKIVAILLCLFLGTLGIHRFYVGKTRTGIAILLTGGFFGIWPLIDLIMLLTNTFTDAQGRVLGTAERSITKIGTKPTAQTDAQPSTFLIYLKNGLNLKNVLKWTREKAATLSLISGIILVVLVIVYECLFWAFFSIDFEFKDAFLSICALLNPVLRSLSFFTIIMAIVTFIFNAEKVKAIIGLILLMVAFLIRALPAFK